MRTRTGTTVKRGDGAGHTRLRKIMVPIAGYTPCAWCGRLMLSGQALDLDRPVPASQGGVGDPITRARCNRSRGARAT